VEREGSPFLADCVIWGCLNLKYSKNVCFDHNVLSIAHRAIPAINIKMHTGISVVCMCVQVSFGAFE